MLKDKFKITHLTFSGGGIQGSVLVGGLRFLYLEGLDKNITHISCCSVGSYVALMFCFKFSIKEMEDTIKALVKCDKFNFIPKANYLKMFGNLGLTQTTILIDHLISKIHLKYPEYTIEDLQNFTFMDIAKSYGINLYISTTNLNTCQLKMFSIDDTPYAKVFEVCRASMSIPFLYQPVIIDNHYYIDGGMSNNFPICIFDNVPAENKLGMALHGKKETEDESKTKPTLLFVFNKVWEIVRNVFREKVFLCYLNKPFVLNYENIPVKWFNYQVQKNGLKIFQTSEEELNEMFIFGFHHMMLYFMKKEKMLDIRLIQDDTTKNESETCTTNM